MSTSGHESLINQWAANFKASDWFVTREGKTRFNYFKARSLYFGTIGRENAIKGFQKYYMDSAKATDNSSAVLKGLEILESIGIVIENRGPVVSQSTLFLLLANTILKALADPRNQYKFNVENPFETVNGEVVLLAKMLSGEVKEDTPKKVDENKFNRYVSIPSRLFKRSFRQ